MENIYICPMCEEKNEEHRTYCKVCGTWLLNNRFPPRKLEKRKRTKNNFGITILVLVIIGAVWYFTTSGAANPFGGLANPFTNKLTFGQIDVGQYSFSQLEITNGVKSSIPVDLTVTEKSIDPIEIAAVFYSEDGTRIGRASTIITAAMDAGYMTTLNLKLDEPTNLIAARSVRMEVKPLAPFELLEKAFDNFN